MLEIKDLKFDQNGLIPAIVVDAQDGKVLMLAYMNAESLQITMDEGTTCFWSRSRQELWRKGETSGNRQHVLCIKADCDRDTLTVLVTKDGPACHTGAETCFNDMIYTSGTEAPFSFNTLEALLADRREKMPEGSYTTYLFAKGMDKILKKVGEESTEVIIAGKNQDKAEAIYEIADLAYHVMVMMNEMGISVDEVKAELASRHIIDHKVKQEKMK